MNILPDHVKKKHAISKYNGTPLKLVMFSIYQKDNRRCSETSVENMASLGLVVSVCSRHRFYALYIV